MKPRRLSSPPRPAGRRDRVSLSLLLAASLAGVLLSASAGAESVHLPDLDDPRDYRGYRLDVGGEWSGASETGRGLGDVTGNGRGDMGFFIQGSGGAAAIKIIPGRASGQKQALSESPEKVTVTFNADLSFFTFVSANFAGGGDVTGNGADDLVIGFPEYIDPLTESAPGAVFIVEGPITDDIEISQASLLESPQLRLIRGPSSEASFSYFASSVAIAGDFNGDGIQDILVGEPYTPDGDGSRLHVIFGGGEPAADSVEALAMAGGAIVIEGGGPIERVGRAFAAAGDFNGDGIDDIIVGDRWGGTIPDEPFAYEGNGKAAVIFGSHDPFSFRFDDEVEMDHVRIAYAEQPGQGAQLGAAVTGIGDFNGDGFMDVAVGIPGGYSAEQSMVAVILGGPAAPGEVIHATGNDGRAVLFTIDNEPFFVETKESGSARRVGEELGAVGDVNGDGFADLLIGGDAFAGYTGTYGPSGKAFLVFGSDAPTGGALEDIEEGALPGVVYHGGEELTMVGERVTGIGEVSGDLRGDFMISATAFEGSDIVARDTLEVDSTSSVSHAYVVFSSPLPPKPEIFTLSATGEFINIDHSGVTNPSGTVGAMGTWFRILEPGPQPWVYMGLTTYLGGETFMAIPWEPGDDALYEIAARPRDAFGWVGDYVYTTFGEAPAAELPSGPSLTWDEDAQAAILTFEEAGAGEAHVGFWSRPIAAETDPGRTTHALGGWTYYGLTPVPPLATTVELDFLRGGDVHQLATAIRNPDGAGFLDTRDIVAAAPGVVINPRPGGIVFPPTGGDFPAVLLDPVGNNPDVAIELEYRPVDILGKATVAGPWQAWRSGGYMDGPHASPRRVDSTQSVPPLTDPFMEYEFRARLVQAEHPHAPVTGNLELNNKVPFKADGLDTTPARGLHYHAINAGSFFGTSLAVVPSFPGPGAHVVYAGAPGYTDDAPQTGALFSLSYRDGGDRMSGDLVTNHNPGLVLGLPPRAEFGASVVPLGLYGSPPTPRLLVGAPGTDGELGALWVVDMGDFGVTPVAAHAITSADDAFPAGLGEGARFGQSLAYLGDLNGDGLIQVAVGSPGLPESRHPGAVHILSLSDEGRLVEAIPLIDDESAELLPPGVVGFGFALAFLGDLQGPGTPHLAISSGVGFLEEGGVHLAGLGADGAARTLSTLQHESANPHFGASLAGGMDLDDDGTPDLAVGEPILPGVDFPEKLEFGPGVRLFSLDPTEPGAVRGEAFLEGSGEYGVAPTDQFGLGLALADDLLAAGHPTLLVGSPREDARALDEGNFLRFAVDFRTTGLAIPNFRRDTGVAIFPLGRRGLADDAVSSIARITGFLLNDQPGYMLGFPSDGAFGSVLLTPINSANQLPSTALHRLTPGSHPVLSTTASPPGMRFGASVLQVPGMGGIGSPFVLVGAPGFTPEDSLPATGALYVVQLDPSGLPALSHRHGAFDFLSEYLTAGAEFGTSLAYVGVSTVQGNPTRRIAVGAPGLSDSASEPEQEGGVFLLDLDAATGQLLAVEEIRNGIGLAPGTIPPAGRFGESLHVLPTGPWEIGSSTVLAAGIPGWSRNDPGQGAVLFIGLNSDATVSGQSLIEPGVGSFEDFPPPPFGRFGAALGGVGDFDGDTIPDLLVGMPGDPGGSQDAGAPNPGAIYVLMLNRDLTVRYWKKIERATALAEGPQGLLRLIPGDEADLGRTFLTLPPPGQDALFQILLGGRLTEPEPAVSRLDIIGTETFAPDP